MDWARLLIVVATLALLTACDADEDADSAGSVPATSNTVTLSPQAVETAGIDSVQVERRVLKRTLSLTGTLAAKPWIPEEQGALSEAESADAARRLAQARYARIAKLAAEGIVSRQDLDAVEASRDQASAAAAQADARLANLGLDETARALERQARIWGLAVLPESELPLVRAGAAVRVETFAYAGRQFHGRVISISRSVDPETRGFTVRIAIDDGSEDLHPQMLATFVVSVESPEALVIPRSAVLLEGDGSWVYVADASRFERHEIQTGVSTRDEVEVLEGLEAGQMVVSSGAQILESERLKSRLRPADED